MGSKEAVAALFALGHEGRLSAFRLLVRAGHEGLPAGEIARQLGVPANTLSANLTTLTHAGLIRSRRQGRSIIYTSHYASMTTLLEFLMEDCCNGAPEICAPLTKFAARVRTGDERTRYGQAPVNVLFLCTGNSARSIMAEAVLNKLGGGRFQAYSAGSHPKGAVDPDAIAVLQKRGYPTTGLHSKSWSEFGALGAPRMDFIFTVCDDAAGESCPLWPGRPASAHWGLEDPSKVEGDEVARHAAFDRTLRFIEQRLKLFVELPMESLDASALVRQLQQIGRIEGSTRTVA